jgi:hypothetical protein
MQKINRHIAFEYDVFSKIEDYARANKITFTKAVNDIIKKSMPYEEELMIRIDNNVKATSKVANLTYNLIKQLYSDLSFPKLTNVKDSKSLNDFLRKQNNIDD